MHFAGDSVFLCALETEQLQKAFKEDIRPLLSQYCFDCHSEKRSKAGVRVDYLDGSIPDKEVRHWKTIRKQLLDEEMPPEEEPQLSQIQRLTMVAWIDDALTQAKTRVRPKNGGARRLHSESIPQYIERFTGNRRGSCRSAFPPDAKSKDTDS